MTKYHKKRKMQMQTFNNSSLLKVSSKTDCTIELGALFYVGEHVNTDVRYFLLEYYSFWHSNHSKVCEMDVLKACDYAQTIFQSFGKPWQWATNTTFAPVWPELKTDKMLKRQKCKYSTTHNFWRFQAKPTAPLN